MKSYELTLTQSCPATPGQPRKQPFHIPFAVGLVGADGRDLPLTVQGRNGKSTIVLEMTRARETFKFEGVFEKPVPSLLRDFSAPVILEYPYTDEELLHLFSHDSDPVNRWEAGQRLAMSRLLRLTAAIRDGSALHLDDTFVEALRKILVDESLDAAFREVALLMPAETLIADQMDVVDPQAIHLARQFVRGTIGRKLRRELQEQMRANETPGPYSPDAISAGKRGLKNLCMSYLAAAQLDMEHAEKQFDDATNMTDRVAALSALIHADSPAARRALDAFYNEFEHEALVIDKWFALQAGAPHADVHAVRKLMKHKAFNIKNPNRARSLVFSFCNANPAQFHAPDGSGYKYWAEQVIALDRINPQVAARLARTMDRWRRYLPSLQVRMRDALEQVSASGRLSNDVREVIGKALAND